MWTGRVLSKRCITTIAPGGEVEVDVLRGGRVLAFGPCHGKAAGPAHAIAGEMVDTWVKAVRND